MCCCFACASPRHPGRNTSGPCPCPGGLPRKPPGTARITKRVTSPSTGLTLPGATTPDLVNPPNALLPPGAMAGRALLLAFQYTLDHAK